MPISKALNSTNIINAFTGTPDGTKFLRDDGSLAAAGGGGYSKLLASGVNEGTLTLYDDTASTGVSQFVIRAGAGQSTNYLAKIFANDGTTAYWTFSATGMLTSVIDTSVNDFGLKVGRIGHTDAVRMGDVGYGAGGEVTIAASSGNVGINEAGASGIFFGSGHKIGWTSTAYIVGASNDIEIKRSDISVLLLSDGSTGVSAALCSRFVQPKTADYSVALTDSNSVFTNEGTTAKRNFTLPSAVANLVYTFVVQDSDGLTVTANTGDTIQDNATVSGSAGNIDSTDVGASVTLIAINATQWVVTSMTGTWVIT